MGANTLVRKSIPLDAQYQTTDPITSVQLDRLVGLAMLGVATAVFLYYSLWTLVMVRPLITRHNTARTEAQIRTGGLVLYLVQHHYRSIPLSSLLSSQSTETTS
jgi:hypothetical protein